MGIELSKGNLFITMGDETMPLGSGIPFTEEIELSAKEYLSHYYSFKDMYSKSLTISNANLELLNDVFNMPLSNGKFTMEYQMPIMIQARWHKKPRIRKKWLKRFGMKSDTVKVKVHAKALEYYPGRILDDQYDPNGICATFNSFDFECEADKREYIFRPDQKRRGIKVEW